MGEIIGFILVVSIGCFAGRYIYLVEQDKNGEGVYEKHNSNDTFGA